jgi:hypothetical protein
MFRCHSGRSKILWFVILWWIRILDVLLPAISFAIEIWNCWRSIWVTNWWASIPLRSINSLILRRHSDYLFFTVTLFHFCDLIRLLGVPSKHYCIFKPPNICFFCCCDCLFFFPFLNFSFHYFLRLYDCIFFRAQLPVISETLFVIFRFHVQGRPHWRILKITYTRMIRIQKLIFLVSIVMSK